MNEHAVSLPTAPPETGRRRIFIIDDEEPIRKVLDTHLSKSGYEVILSGGGGSVFSALEGNSFDLIISDIKMPEIDGVEILEYARKSFETVPIIMLTGLTDVTMAIEVMKKGAFDYLMKPVRKQDLLTVIQRALVHRDLLERNRRLEEENRHYQMSLEGEVASRTRELQERTNELQEVNGLLKTMNIQFVNVLADAIEAKDDYTRGHCNRMRYLCVELGRLMDLSARDLEILEYASLLHDLGKIGTSEAVLNKPGPLTEQECHHLKEHPTIGEKILHGVDLMEEVAAIIGAHHENFDGSGYPNGLAGGEIPIEARIIAVADLFDAMSSDRPYRKGLSIEAVLSEMESVAGTQLDPEIVKLFIFNKIYLFKKN
ncbi:MAG: HD domain-containing phosphohydrolase [Thermodesulfobacteriota bacterium]